MARRSSARLRGRESSTPKRVSLSHDTTTRCPRTVPTKLPSLQENEEMPGTFPASPSYHQTPSGVSRTAVATPTTTTPIRPSSEEMHPQHHQQTTVKPMQEARHLGFSNMCPHTEPAKHISRIAAQQETPTRSTAKPESKLQSPGFKFTFQREHSLELSPEAKRLMLEKRGEAIRIRQQMVADGEGPKSAAEILGRPMAIPKGSRGRFSDVHSSQFQRMDSIANHASTFRADRNRLKAAAPQAGTSPAQTTSKSLKRSPSKAELDGWEESVQSSTKSTLPLPTTHVVRTNSVYATQSRPTAEPMSPAKRVKRAELDDSSTRRPPQSDDRPLPTTPTTNKNIRMQTSYPDLSNLTSPTQASLGRANSISSTRTSRIPGPQLSAAKPPISFATTQTAQETGPYLARSPSKGPVFAKPAAEILETTAGPLSPLLSRSPSKASLFKKPVNTSSSRQMKVADEPLLLRSPSKLSLVRKTTQLEESREVCVEKTPLLSRSPFKMSVTKDVECQVLKSSATPFLLRSPSKIVIPEASQDTPTIQNAEKPVAKGLIGRFELLRSTPAKSILRSPQRLYSNDPAKVAAGTHMTPPKFSLAGRKMKNEPPATAPVSKRVDFSLSTKARDEITTTTPSKPSTLPIKFGTCTKIGPIAEYPSLPTFDAVESPSPQKRRQTATPGDFTFRAGEHDIIFSRSPNAPTEQAKSKRPSTIRHVSADTKALPPPAVGSKKRKFDFENEVFAANVVTTGTEDKENMENAIDEDQRPMKRTKTNPVSPAPPSMKKAPTAPRTTPGVKPRGAKASKASVSKRPSTISQARLNALSQPKRKV